MKKKTFISYVFSEARKSETLDINNKKKPFIQRNGRFLIALPLSTFIVFTNSYNDTFLQLAASILSILIGLFITSLVFAMDKFYTPLKNKKEDYKLDVVEKELVRNLEISIDKYVFENSHEKLWQKQSLYYVQKFNVLVGKSVIVGVWTLALICLNVMYYDFFHINFYNYSIVSLDLYSLLIFLKLFFISIFRFLICYYMIEIFYNTIEIISSMVNFMAIKIKK